MYQDALQNMIKYSQMFKIPLIVLNSNSAFCLVHCACNCSEFVVGSFILSFRSPLLDSWQCDVANHQSFVLLWSTSASIVFVTAVSNFS